MPAQVTCHTVFKEINIGSQQIPESTIVAFGKTPRSEALGNHVSCHTVCARLSLFHTYISLCAPWRIFSAVKLRTYRLANEQKIACCVCALACTNAQMPSPCAARLSVRLSSLWSNKASVPEASKRQLGSLHQSTDARTCKQQLAHFSGSACTTTMKARTSGGCHACVHIYVIARSSLSHT